MPAILYPVLIIVKNINTIEFAAGTSVAFGGKIPGTPAL